MRELLKNIKNDGMLRQSILINMIICGCMAFFYVDSGKMIEPLLYAIFFLCYVISALIFGRKCIPIMYIIFVAGAVQDTTFINCTSFFILVFISWCFPKWTKFLYSFYFLDILLVCYRHNKTVWHLLAHFSFCLVFWLLAESVKHYIQRTDMENVSKTLVDLKLEENEEIIVKELAEGKLLKEIPTFSKNTKTKYLKQAMQRNNCSTPSELAARYKILNEIHKSH